MICRFVGSLAPNMPLVFISESKRRIWQCIKCVSSGILTSRIKELQSLYHSIRHMGLRLFWKLIELSNSISKHNQSFLARALVEYSAKLEFTEVLSRRTVPTWKLRQMFFGKTIVWMKIDYQTPSNRVTWSAHRPVNVVLSCHKSLIEWKRVRCIS